MNNVFVFWVAFVFLILIFALFAIGLWIGSMIKKQANKPIKRFFAPIPRPGTFSFVSLEGKIVDVLEGVVGWHLEPVEKLKGGKCFFIGGKETPSGEIEIILENYLGVKWLGLYRTIRTFPEWKWTEFKQIETEIDGVKVPTFQVISKTSDKNKPVSEFFFQFTYPVVMDNVEISGNIQIKITVAMIVWHLYPVRAFFLNPDSTALFNAMVQAMIRLHVAEKTFEAVKGMRASKDEKDSDLWIEIDKLNGITLKSDGNPDYENAKPDGLFGKLGSMIVRGEVISIEATGETQKAIEAKRMAILKGDAAIEEAERKGEAIVVTAQKEAEAIRKRVEAQKLLINETIVGPTGGPGVHVADVLVAERIGNSKVTTYVAGSKSKAPQALIAIPPSGGKGEKTKT